MRRTLLALYFGKLSDKNHGVIEEVKKNSKDTNIFTLCTHKLLCPDPNTRLFMHSNQ
jgi:hypothetical protein